MVELKRCTRCVLPETHETILFDSEGVCNICKGQEYKQNKIDWDAKSLTSGVYIVHWRANGFGEIKKLILLK